MTAALGLQLTLQPEQEIFAFRAKELVGAWVSSSDRAIGGERSVDFASWATVR